MAALLTTLDVIRHGEVNNVPPNQIVAPFLRMQKKSWHNTELLSKLRAGLQIKSRSQRSTFGFRVAYYLSSATLTSAQEILNAQAETGCHHQPADNHHLGPGTLALSSRL